MTRCTPAFIVTALLLAGQVLAQKPGVVSESFVAQARDNLNKEVMIKGIAGHIKPDASTNTVVYSLTDKYEGTIRVRTEKGTPNLDQVYVVRGIVIAPSGSTELEIIEHEKYTPPKTPSGQPEPDWNFAGVPDAGSATGTNATPGTPSGGEKKADDGSKKADDSGDKKRSPMAYLLLGGGAILVIAAVGIGMAMKSANDRRVREEQFRQEQQRMVAEQQRMAEMQHQAVAPGATLVVGPSPTGSAASAPSPGTMVSWGNLTATAGPLKDGVFPLGHGKIVIGRDQGDIPLKTDQSVSSRHATISQSGDGTVHFEDHSTNGSFVNERRLNNEKVTLQSGDKIVIGPHTLEIKYSKAALAAPAAPPASGSGGATVVVPAQMAATIAFSGLQLLVEDGVDKGRSFPVNPPQTTIGRESRDIVLSDEHVSRKHASVIAQDGKWVLQNESNQGTFVNDAKVESQELHEGDRIRMGATVMVFQRLA